MILSQRTDSLFLLKCFIIYFIRKEGIHIYILFGTNTVETKTVESYIKYYFIAHTYLKLKNYKHTSLKFATSAAMQGVSAQLHCHC